jgi:hypothetical protein
MSSWCLSSGFPTKIVYAFLFSLIHVTCTAHLILLDLIILILLDKEYRLWSPTLSRKCVRVTFENIISDLQDNLLSRQWKEELVNAIREATLFLENYILWTKCGALEC